MNASKETALQAQSDLNKAEAELSELDTKEPIDSIKKLLFNVGNFVDAARRKLPTEAAYDAEAKRKPKKTTQAKS